MKKTKLILDIEPPEGILNGSECKTYQEPRRLELEAMEGYLILKSVVEAINHYYVLTDKKPKYLVMGYEQYKHLIVECYTYFKEPNEKKVFEEITLLGITLQIILLPVQVGVHISGGLQEVFKYCAQKELYP